MSTNFLQQVQSAMEGRFMSDPVLAENVVSVEVIDTQFMVVTHLQMPTESGYDSHYYILDATMDDNDLVQVNAVIYAFDEEDQAQILNHIQEVAEVVASL